MDKSICFVTTGDIKNIATAKRALGLANPLSSLGWKVSILMEDTEENRKRVRMECQDDILVKYFPKSGAFDEIKVKTAFLREIQPSFAYICAMVVRNCIGLPKGCQRLVEHCELPTKMKEVVGINLLRCQALEKYSVLASDGLINASLYLQQYMTKLASRLHRKKMPQLYLPYAYNPSTIKVLNIDRSLPEFSKFAGRKIFVFLGSIDKNYGSEDIIETFIKLSDQYPNVLLLMLGRGRDYERLKQRVEEAGCTDNICMPGYVKEEDISFYFSLTDYFLLPMNDTIQDWARCPSKLYMYLPYNKPIISCKIGEVYAELKENGVYYETSNRNSLYKCVSDLLDKQVKTNIYSSKATWQARATTFDSWIAENYIHL